MAAQHFSSGPCAGAAHDTQFKMAAAGRVQKCSSRCDVEREQSSLTGQARTPLPPRCWEPGKAALSMACGDGGECVL